MTIQGALNDLSNLINSSDIPMYYKPSLKKIKETIELEMQPKMGEWIEEDTEQGALGFQYTRKKCSKCGWTHGLLIPKDYCPNCGSYNGGGEE